MAQAARFSFWKRGFESRWGHRADLPTCGFLRSATPRRSSLPISANISVLSVPAARRPGIGLRTRLARFDSSQRDQSTSAALSRAASCPCSRGTRHKPPKLVAQVRFLAGAPQGGTVPSGVHTPGSAGSIPAPAIRGASGRAAALIRLSVEVRILPPRPVDISIGAGRYGDLSSLIRSSFRVRLPAAPLSRTEQGSFSGESTGVTSRIR